jgi:hypothetical protein
MNYRSCLLFVTFCLLAISSCKLNYSFSGASVSPDVKTVAILSFKNNAPLAKPTYPQQFAEALRDVFTSQTNLGIVQKNGDLNFEGEITGYGVVPTAIQTGDQAALNRLTISVNVKFTNTKNEKQNFETVFTRYADFPRAKSLNDAERDLIKQINDQLAIDVFNRAMINW